MSNNQKPRSATERLSEVEQSTMSIFQAMDNMSRDLMLVKDAIKLLGNKVDSMAKLSVEGLTLSDDNISAEMVKTNVSELKSKVDSLIDQGILIAEAVITNQSFVVLQEVDETGKVVNPRLQFTMGAIDPSVTEKLVGCYLGQIVQIKEGSLSVEILEIYSIAGTKPQEQVPSNEPSKEAVTPEAAPNSAEQEVVNS